MLSLRRRFDRAAPGYDRHARVQRAIAAQLLGRLDLIRISPAVVVDLGAGTGAAADRLSSRFPFARVLAADFSLGMLRRARMRGLDAVACDARRLPFPDGSVDLVFSSSALQWCEPLADTFDAVRCALRPDGLFLFATFGPDTLRELRAAQAAAGIAHGVNDFRDMHPLGDLLREQGWRDPVLDAERLAEEYDSPLDLLRQLQGVGSSRSRPEAVSRAQWRRMLEAYPKDANGRARATFEVVFGYARAASPGEAGVATVPLSAVGRPKPVE